MPSKSIFLCAVSCLFFTAAFCGNPVSAASEPLHSAASARAFCESLQAPGNRDACENVVATVSGLPAAHQEILEQREAKTINIRFCQQYRGERAAFIFCRKRADEQNQENRNQSEILERRQNWTLTQEFCMQQKNYEHYQLCQTNLADQLKNCPQQKTSGANIYIDLHHQLLFAVKNCELKVFTRIISGRNSMPTPSGSWRIAQRRTAHWMQGQWFVNMAFYYYGDYAIHDAGWRSAPEMWSTAWRAWGGSHGCINTPHEAMEVLWNEFDVGTPVHIYKILPRDIADEIWAKVGTRSPVDPSQG